MAAPVGGQAVDVAHQLAERAEHIVGAVGVLAVVRAGQDS